LTCRICLDTDDRSRLIAPCSCAGSSRWVHRECLDRWRSTREDIAFSKCTECLTPYVLFSPRPRNSPPAMCSRYIRFLRNLCRDLCGPLLSCVAAVIALSLIMCAFDYKSHYLIDKAHFEKYPKAFYVLLGTLVSLSLVGIMFMFYWFNGDTGNTMASDSCTACRDCCNCCCASGRTGPMYVYDPCLGCDGCCNACYCGECCSQGTAAGGTSCAECCTASTMGEECLAVMALACVVLAVVGLFVSVFAGLVYANRSIQRHIHIVSKMTMTEDLVVKDL
ncbi:unnamed protein product, partial [Ectocarpus fasciculatus]